jgi:hypothetical protein
MSDEVASVFTFTSWQLDPPSGRLSLHYHDARFGDFTETLVFPSVDPQRVANLGDALTQAIHCLHWMAGASYYKTSLAETIQFNGSPPDMAQAEWLQQTWQAGLAELAYQNQLGWLDQIRFTGQGRSEQARPAGLKPNSLVCIEQLKAVGEDLRLFMVGQSAFIKQVAASTGLDVYQVRRELDPRLMLANQQGAFNGHIPVTAINACIGVVAALLGDFDAVVFANERSADVGNVRADNGQWVNHQYSKSLAFEAGWQQIISQSIATDLHCFSLLRPLSELAIIKQFARLPQYFSVFSSCNRNFHLSGSQNQNHHWCGHCPKCAFVFICLAPFISKQTLLDIFRHNILADRSQQDLLEALLDLGGLKPFECVGEARECRVALALLSKHPDWQNSEALRDWLGRIGQVPDEWYDELMRPDEAHIIPDKRGFQVAGKHHETQ